jgi:hypothetical protein
MNFFDEAEKMFLYEVTKPTTETYKVRFAVFPETDHA